MTDCLLKVTVTSQQCFSVKTRQRLHSVRSGVGNILTVNVVRTFDDSLGPTMGQKSVGENEENFPPM